MLENSIWRKYIIVYAYIWKIISESQKKTGKHMKPIQNFTWKGHTHKVANIVSYYLK